MFEGEDLVSERFAEGFLFAEKSPVLCTFPEFNFLAVSLTCSPSFGIKRRKRELQEGRSSNSTGEFSSSPFHGQAGLEGPGILA